MYCEWSFSIITMAFFMNQNRVAHWKIQQPNTHTFMVKSLGSKLSSISPFDPVISQGRGLTRILKYRSDMRYFGGMGFGRMGGVVLGERE